MTDAPKEETAPAPAEGAPAAPAPAAPPEKVQELEKEAEKVEAKIDHPATTDTERAQLSERLDRIEAAIEKIAAAPTAPSPRKEPAAPEGAAPAGDTPKDPEKPRKARTSARWFGERAYDE